MEKTIKIYIDKEKNKKLNYQKVTDAEVICCSCCKYDGVCNKIPDPEHIDDKSRSFMDYCTALDKIEPDIYPVSGTLEDNIKDILPENLFYVSDIDYVKSWIEEAKQKGDTSLSLNSYQIDSFTSIVDGKDKKGNPVTIRFDLSLGNKLRDIGICYFLVDSYNESYIRLSW